MTPAEATMPLSEDRPMKVGDPVTTQYALRAATAIYLEVPQAVADDVSRVIRSLVDMLEARDKENAELRARDYAALLAENLRLTNQAVEIARLQTENVALRSREAVVPIDWMDIQARITNFVRIEDDSEEWECPRPYITGKKEATDAIANLLRERGMKVNET